jgi:hypothetical protein
MSKLLAIGFIFLGLTLSGMAAGSGPDIRIVDNRVSIQAEAIPLGRFLHLWDQATGMTSKVPPELANRNVSVRFTDLNFDDAVRKIFEGQPVDYVVVGGRGIIVTGTSQILSARNNSGPVNSPPPQEPVVEQNPFQQQFQQPGQPNFPGQAGIAGVPGAPNGGVAGAQQQPATIQTPFGSIPNPRANQPQQGTSPMVMPGQVTSQNPFNSSLPGFNSSGQLPTLQSNPPFGTTTPANTSPFNNSPFGSTPAYPSSYPNTVPNNGFPGTTTPSRPNP